MLQWGRTHGITPERAGRPRSRGTGPPQDLYSGNGGWRATLIDGDDVTAQVGPLRALLVAVLMVGIAGLAEGRHSSALFTAQVTNPANAFQAGTLRMSNSRSGQALFATGGAANGVATATMSVLASPGSIAYAPRAATGTFAPGTAGVSALPTDPGFLVPGTGGLLPGMLLVNSVTIGNVGSLAAGAVNLSVPSITVTNDAGAHCDVSNALVVDGVDTCGRGRLTDTMRLVAFYLTGDGKAMCVVGAQAPGMIVAATTDGAALMACAGTGQATASPTFGVSLGIPLTRNAAGVAGGPFALAGTSSPLTIPGTATTGDRIELGLSSLPVWNYRNGTAVRDWAAGETRAITFAVFIDSAADNRYQGARASVDVRWESTSLTGAVVAPPPVAPPPVGLGTISGTLTGPAGAMVSHPVSLYSHDFPFLGATTGATGNFVFASLAPGAYDLVAWVDGIPAVSTVTVAAGQASTVTLVATVIDRSLTVTITPAPTAAQPWTAFAMVSANMSTIASGTFHASYGGTEMTVGSPTFVVDFRSTDAARTSLQLYSGSPGPSSALRGWRPLADSPATLSVTVPTVTVVDLTCTAASCTGLVNIAGLATGATFHAFLVPSTDPYGYRTPATTQGHVAGQAVQVTFERPATLGTYVVEVEAHPGGGAPGWSWTLRTSSMVSVGTP